MTTEAVPAARGFSVRELERAWAPRLLSLLRFMTGLLFLEHGTSKIIGWPVQLAFPDMPPPFTLQWGAGILEVVGAPLLMLGLFTRPTAFVMSGFMAVAYFLMLAPRNPFPMNNTGDSAILFCFVCLYLFAAGAGPYSLDAWLKSRAGAAA